MLMKSAAVNTCPIAKIIYANDDILVWSFQKESGEIEVFFMMAKDCDGIGAPSAPVEYGGKTWMVEYSRASDTWFLYPEGH